MFDLRYHVASLAAVFVALLIGILVGVGLTGKVDDAEKSALRSRAEAAERQVQALAEERADAGQEQDATRVLAQRGYPLLMENLLRGRRIALLFVGSVDRDARAAVGTTLEDAGAGGLTRMRALNVPINPERLDRALADRSALARYRGERRLHDLGQLLAEELVSGGDAPAWDALGSIIVEEQRGPARPLVEGVVVARSAEPQTGPSARFLAGLYEGLAESGTPAVGVETTSVEFSAIEVFERAGLSSVDNVETEPGRVALALLLAGAEPGSYGVKDTADAVLPPDDRAAQVD